MWQSKKLAYLQQRVVFITPDEITDEQSEYLDGWVRFKYDTLQWETDNTNPRLDKNQEVLKMVSYEEIKIRRGDRVKVGNDIFNVTRVVEKIDEQHEKFVTLNPRTKRFRYKEITLE